MRTKYFWVVLFLLIIQSCDKPDEILGPLNPSLLPEVRYVKLILNDYSNSSTMVANGKSTVQLSMAQYDKDKKFLFNNIPYNSIVKVNGVTPLSYPFTFKTTEPGVVNFSLEGYPETALLVKTVTVTAIADKTYEDFVLPVIFHFITNPTTTVSELTMKALVDSHIRQLNLAFHDLMGSKDPNSVNSYLSFEAATTDVNGNVLPHAGLDIIPASPYIFKNSDDAGLNTLIWNGNFWSPKKYVNVWVAEFEENYSWGRFPYLGTTTSAFPTNAYGVFLNIKHFTDAKGSVMIHEAGHLLNLFHNFNSQCSPDIDQCSDTHDYLRVYSEDYKGGLIRTGCDNIKFPGVNYMDYYPNEYNTFTYQQRERIRKTLALCPFLPTPANIGGRIAFTVSSLDMPWVIDPSLSIP